MRKAADTIDWARMHIETVDMEPFANFVEDVGFWKHQCNILCGFDWRRAEDMYRNASIEQLVNMIRSRYHYFNSGDQD